MSISIMTQVWNIDLPASQKIVLLALADCANDEGLAWPGMASLSRKCSKSERTIQTMMVELEAAGHITREQVPGKGCRYTVHPGTSAPSSIRDTPAKSAPRNFRAPQKTTETPAKSAPKPSRTINNKNTERAHVIPDGWAPGEFGSKSKCRDVVMGWTAGELTTQIEHFTKHHRSKGNRFVSWQDAWETWVLNSRRWGARGTHPKSTNPPGQPDSYLTHLIAKRQREQAQ